jgi:hypothetical protein
MRRTMVWVAMLLSLVGCDDSQRRSGPVSEDRPNESAGSRAPVGGTAAAVDSPSVTEHSPAQDDNEKPDGSAPAMAAMPQAAPAAQGSPTQSTPPAQASMTPSVPAAQGNPPPSGFKPNAMNECGLQTKWRGDEYCILPPPPDQGFQLHIGPTNYDNPEAVYVLQPGQETVHAYTTKSANDRDIDFYIRQYRMRPGAHHTIVRDTSTGRRLSGSNVNQDHPVGGIIAPENAGIGIPLTAHAPITVDHHAINTTSEPLLQEVWVNFWYVDPSKVTDTTNLLYDPGSITATVAPRQDVVLGPYECDIKTPGRLISMFGHVHANNVRFSAWRTRAGKRELIYESHRWEEPLWLEFTSLAKNPAADPALQIDGGWTGILDLQPGDTLGWECHEVNQQETTLRFINQTYTGTMCIIIGDLVGTKCASRNPSAIVNPNLE